MKGTKAVVCRQCGALNRPTWEFCARCNESLESATTVEESIGPAIAAEDDAEASSAPANTIALAGILALVIVGAAAWRTLASNPTSGAPDPSIFTIGTQPSELPTPAPPAEAGGGEYDAGRRALNSGNLAVAVERLADAVAADPTNAEFRNALGHALWRSGDREGALAAHAEAARLDPRLQLQYARSLDVAGRSAEAAAQYQRILAENPAASTVREDLGRLLFRSGDYRGAAAHLQSAVQSRPDDPVLQQELAYSLDQAGDRVQAAAVYREVLAKAPGAVVSRSLLAENLVEQGRGDDALSVLQEGLRAQPEAPMLQRQLGAVLERTGRPKDAAAAYRAYAGLAPNAADARDLLARAGRLEAAGGQP
ncbi:MAG TPA: tetratricopeptide repeat protein [Vicinamibacteria bacterium]|nr:tetratricopeptide repeat protein [Vicinamibacteria bacterium]